MSPEVVGRHKELEQENGKLYQTIMLLLKRLLQNANNESAEEMEFPRLMQYWPDTTLT